MLIAYLYAEKRALITDADCKSWKCSECADMLRQRWTLKAAHGARVLMETGTALYFATITSHERLKTFEECAYVFPDAWGKLHKRLNRTDDLRQYFLTPEKHKDGRMHMHAIWTFPVKTRWLKDNGRECGFGYKNQIGRRGFIDEKIEDPKQVSEYVSKYLGKQLGDELPVRFRRVRTSQNWPDVPETNTEASAYEWAYLGGNGALSIAYEHCAENGLTMIDMRTGEIFEDEDLGTVVWDGNY